MYLPVFSFSLATKISLQINHKEEYTEYKTHLALHWPLNSFFGFAAKTFPKIATKTVPKNFVKLS